MFSSTYLYNTYRYTDEVGITPMNNAKANVLCIMYMLYNVQQCMLYTAKICNSTALG